MADPGDPDDQTNEEIKHQVEKIWKRRINLVMETRLGKEINIYVTIVYAIYLENNM